MVTVQTFPLPPFDKKEILRYAGAGECTPEVRALLDECMQLAAGIDKGQVAYARFPIVRRDKTLDLAFAKTRSEKLGLNLRGCDEIILMAATIGLTMDRLIARAAAVSQARAMMLQAIGAERIESLCDAFCGDLAEALKAEGLCLRPRFSPGYGDLPLALQRDIFAALDCSRQIGLTLNDSLLMSPSKSVTAIIGLSKTGCERPKGCAACEKTDCTYRREA